MRKLAALLVVVAAIGAAVWWSMRPVPVGWFRRLRLLGTMQAKVGAAYLFHWLRGWFKDADENKRLLAETHWRTAVRILDTMSYLRGATMKVGQMMGNFPDIAPQEFTETLEKLHFEAPPMHWSLLKEMVFSELQEDPESLFASFEKRAFAAASLGQVHRARLRNGQELAVKIQYPGIADTIGDDVRNLLMFMLPARLSRDWENTKEQFDDLRHRLERETDYEQEAAMLRRVRGLFREHDGQHVEVGTAEVGSVLGEMALIADTRRLTSAEAATDAEVLRINRSMFRRILEEYPETAESLRAQIIEDLQALIRRIEQVGERLG